MVKKKCKSEQQNNPVPNSDPWHICEHVSDGLYYNVMSKVTNPFFTEYFNFRHCKKCYRFYK